jgi:sugar lactone lactonase YvrE
VDSHGNVYVADYSNHMIRKITPDGTVTRLAGSGTMGAVDGLGAAASFRYPSAVAVDQQDNVYVADSQNHTVRKINASGEVTTLAGTRTAGSTDGAGTSASFNSPYGVAVDADANVYVADMDNHRIRKITPAGEVTTLAGSQRGSADGSGPAALFYWPAGIAVVAVDTNGQLYIADSLNHMIRKMAPLR